MCVNLVLLAKGTALDIAADEGSKSRPPKFGGNQLTCLQKAGVAGRVMVMATLEDGVRSLPCVLADAATIIIP